ncbi:PTS sugar transporter subunit IIC [Brachyspira aalborgi]|uniref:PTS sugar transporter subunit IIC n=1 Tax=Brachyspira aalborgi TaxID=29522 RepID=UPI0011C8AB11|nr:PTS sugar transporter subunit IIC [Brachyspira aalborgi]TXJ15106.1 PTS sugar transporter subunit IIC [Brachyspira aalborgi]TXJ18257.1 PTS sugar transporter subunit IIC [Brachyspira aalborgi]
MNEKFTAFMENKMMPIMAKASANRYLNAIKDAFLLATPFIIIGSFVLLLFNLPMQDTENFLYFKPYDDFAKAFSGDYIQIFNVSMGIMSIFVAFGVGYSLAGYYNSDKVTNGLLSLYAFLLVSAKSLAVTIVGAASDLLFVAEESRVAVLDARYMDAKGLFVAIIAGILSVEISRFLVNKKLTIKLPDSVPPAISKSFEILIPVAVISILFQIVNVIIQKNMLIMVPDLIIKILKPLLNLSDGLFAIIIILLLIHILWFCGIHGANVLNVVVPAIVYTNLAINQEALSMGQAIPKVFAGEFMNCFVYLGGAGATLGLCIGMLMSKNAHLKSIGKLSIVPGFFNINEPIMFGVPIVMNPIFAIPFILTPIINATISYTFMKLNIITRIVALVPWTTPSIIGSFISTNLNFLAPLLIVCLIILDYIIYKPFLNMYIKELEKEETKS